MGSACSCRSDDKPSSDSSLDSPEVALRNLSSLTRHLEQRQQLTFAGIDLARRSAPRAAASASPRIHNPLAATRPDDSLTSARRRESGTLLSPLSSSTRNNSQRADRDLDGSMQTERVSRAVSESVNNNSQSTIPVVDVYGKSADSSSTDRHNTHTTDAFGRTVTPRSTDRNNSCSTVQEQIPDVVCEVLVQQDATSNRNGRKKRTRQHEGKGSSGDSDCDISFNENLVHVLPPVDSTGVSPYGQQQHLDTRGGAVGATTSPLRTREAESLSSHHTLSAVMGRFGSVVDSMGLYNESTSTVVTMDESFSDVAPEPGRLFL